MMAFDIVTLRDGQSQVLRIELSIHTMLLQALEKEDPHALFQLVEKCKDQSCKISKPWDETTTETLVNNGLIDKTGNIPSELQKIVLNYIEIEGSSIRYVDPLAPKTITKM